MLSTNRKGAIAETAIAAAATKLGVSVLRPIVDHERYDLAFEIGDRDSQGSVQMGRVSETTARSCEFNLTRSWLLAQGGMSVASYTEDEIDLVAVYCGELDRSYLLPS